MLKSIPRAARQRRAFAPIHTPLADSLFRFDRSKLRSWPIRSRSSLLGLAYPHADHSGLALDLGSYFTPLLTHLPRLFRTLPPTTYPTPSYIRLTPKKFFVISAGALIYRHIPMPCTACNKALKLIRKTGEDIKLLVDISTRDARLAICSTCDRSMPTNTKLLGNASLCRECGCIIEGKTWFKGAECPLKKW
jgi:hypothetical protein